jgi:DNA invertase Pin-like site-specific DNA recombinase
MPRKPRGPVRVAIYSRVSTDRQTTENQERQLLERAEAAGWEVVKIYRDHAVSGKSGKVLRDDEGERFATTMVSAAGRD